MVDFEKIADANEIGAGERKSAFFDDTPILVIRVGDNYFAIEDVCTHDGQPLTDGPVSESQIECPRHGARFDLESGRALCMPATEAIATFAVDVRDDGVYVGYPD